MKNPILDSLRKIFNAGNLFRPVAKVLRKGDSVFLRAPETIPHEILHDFSALFKKYRNIRVAYLAEGFLTTGEPPHYIIGIKIDHIQIGQLMERMAQELHHKIPKEFYVDFVELNETAISVDKSIGNFMENYLIPFYLRD